MNPGFEIRIDSRQAAMFARAFLAAPDVVDDELYRAGLEAVLLVEREVKERTPSGVGGGAGLKGSIAGRATRPGIDGAIGVVGSPLNYAIPVELGTKPHMPPVEPLADWARFKLGLSDQEARGVGFLIARKIAREGTKGTHMFGRAIAENERQVLRMFSAALERIGQKVSVQ
jgi:hypothetical protein